MELNKALLIGNLTRDPESRTLPTGTQVVKMGLAVNTRRSSTKDDAQEEVLFITVEAWQKTAELCEKYLRKGSMILVEGRLKLNTWTDKENNKRSEIILVADRVQFGPKPSGAGRQDNAGGDEYSAPRSSAAPSRSAPPRPPAGDPGTEDDLPF